MESSPQLRKCIIFIIVLFNKNKRFTVYNPHLFQILTALNFCACGSYQGSMGQNMYRPMAQQTVSPCLQEVTTAINAPHILRKYIKFPKNRNERSLIKQRYVPMYKLISI